jgi:ABC-2 type transport system ATP-binding protein
MWLESSENRGIKINDMNPPFVETRDLTKRFGSFTALDGCSLSVHRGEVFGLLGPNGAGKSTLIRLILGFLNPTSGSATVDGLDCTLQQVNVHRLISYLPGDARLFRMMRGRQVLKFFCDMRNSADYPRALVLAERLELDLSKFVVFMSTGMRQKLALSVCLATSAPLLILDEPTANLDPTVRGEVIKLVDEARRAGRTVLFSSHVLSEIEDVCDRVGILRAGELVHLQCLKELMRKHRISAKVAGSLPEIPAHLRSLLTIREADGRVQIETPGELSAVLHWLANANLQDIYVQPIGLRSVYDKFHRPALAAPTTEPE